jgi:acyl-CoA thioester hydrolase
MTGPFTMTFRVGWAQTDANAHMRNTAYIDWCVDSRFAFFEQHGFPASEFDRLRIGPAIFRDEVDYLNELRLMETVTVTLALAGLSEDGIHFRLHNELFCQDGMLAARVRTTGAWFSLATRKLTVPPEGILAALSSGQRTEDFEVIKPRSRKA